MTKKTSKVLNLEKAYDQVIRSWREGNDFLPDILHFIDTKTVKTEILGNLRNELDNNSFYATDLVTMNVPKDNFLLRPCASPCLKDWILYEALVTYIGSKVDKKLGRRVFSSRFDASGELTHWSEQWKKFDRQFWYDFNKGFQYVVKTDITAYFANIEIKKLRKCAISLLGNSDESKQIVDFLFDRLLSPWTLRGENQGFGLPQGSAASSVLGNIFLYHVDGTLMRDRDIRYLRYSDDIRILAETEPRAKTALKTLIIELRRLGLDLNEKKTQILDRQKAERELIDHRREDLDKISFWVGIRIETTIRRFALPIIDDLFDNSFNLDNPFGARHLRFCVKCFIRLRRVYGRVEDRVLNIGFKLISRFPSMPGSTKVFAQFFQAFPRYEFKRKLLKFLKGPDNVYEWQDMHILDALLRFNNYTAPELRTIRNIAFNKSKHHLVRARAILLLGKSGNEQERYQVMIKFNEHEHQILKRATIIATQELSSALRNEFYGTVKLTDPEHANLVDYLKSIRKPIYFDNYIPDSISVIDERY